MSFIKITEQNSLYNDLERKSVRDLLEDINTEDQKVALAVRETIPKIEELVLQIVPRMKQGGRIFYLGAGTSGRLGVLDASEIPPTFGMPSTLIVGLIAGGDTALRNPVENAEDDEERGTKTVLTDLLAEKLGGTRETFGRSVFRLYAQNQISPTAYVASCAPLVSQAALSGDTAALQILERAGYLIGSQLVALVRKNRLPRSLPVTISGSVWRSHPLLFHTFRDTLAEAGLDGNLHIPTFEPIVGAVIGHYYSVHGTFDASDHARFTEQYQKHAFTVSSDLYRYHNPQKIIPTVKADAPPAKKIIDR